MGDITPPLLRMPVEVRLLIYDLLINDGGHNVFQIRNENPETYRLRKSHLRTSYRVLGRDLMRQSNPTTYCLVTSTEIHTSIMAVNRKIYSETQHILYQNRVFEFGRDVEAIVPFFSDLSKSTRPFIQEISLLKQGSVYSRDFDRCEWTAVCEFLRDHMQISSLNLMVEGGRPSLGWDDLPKYTAADFATLAKARHEPLEWVWELLQVKGLRHLEVHPVIHHCPPSHSSAMSFFAAFSESIATGFAEFLRSRMLHN